MQTLTAAVLLACLLSLSALLWAQREEGNAAAAQNAAPWSDAEVDRLLLRARSQYAAGAPEAALASYRELAARAPDRRELAVAIDRLEREVEARQVLPRLHTRQEMLAEVDESWRRPSVFVDEGGAGRMGAPDSAPLARKLDEIVFPELSFTRMEIGRVVSALSAASVEFDRASRDSAAVAANGAEGRGGAGASARGVNIVLIDPSDRQPLVTLTLRNTSLRRVLDFATQSIGYQYEVQSDAVVVRPGGESSLLETDFFPVSRATVLRMMGMSAQGLSAGTGAARPNIFSASGTRSESELNGQERREGREAPALRYFLQQAGVNFEATPGSSLAYDGSSIIVTHTARNLERVRNILHRYSEIRQVEIEAKFMEVAEGALEELGISWNLNTKQTQRNAGAQAQYTASGRALASAFSSSGATQRGSITRPAMVGPGGEVTEGIDATFDNSPPVIPGAPYLGVGASALASVTGVLGEFDVNAVVRALSQKQGTDLLSAPKVTVLSGNTATIIVAQELRYPQSFGQTQSQVGTGSASGGGSAGVAITAGTPQEFTTRNVGVELRVTPIVEEDDYSISLELHPRVTEFDGFVEYGGPSVAISGSTTVNVPSGFYQPIFSVRDISTKVTIWDGATLIMGGLTREEVKKVNDKVPVVGDIPGLGRLFKSKGQSAQKRNLLIFVTANLLSPGGSPKKQALPNLRANSLFQNPVLITPETSHPRRKTEAREEREEPPEQ